VTINVDNGLDFRLKPGAHLDTRQVVCILVSYQNYNFFLVRAAEDEQTLTENECFTAEFHPNFTYPIFGEDEKIYGYKDLVIDLRFASGSLVQYLAVHHSEKLRSSSTVDDVEGTLDKFIPQGYFKDEKAFLARVEEDANEFKPFGELIHSYTRPSPLSAGKGKGVAPIDPQSDDAIVFEVYYTTWETPHFKEYHRRMQLFILLYIEGGSYIQEDEETWEFVVLFEKRKRRINPAKSTYHFVGYSSLYPFYCFPEKVRMRLRWVLLTRYYVESDMFESSQFVIIPPYQRQGHGSELYNAIYHHVLSRPGIAELTVEDPAEAFEDLRDRNDLRMLLANERFMVEGFGGDAVSHGGGRVGKPGRARAVATGKMGPPTEKMWAEKWRVALKIAGRQFQRLVEMLILLRLDPADARTNRAYRLQVKERLYRFNYEILVQLEKEERLAKLEETFQGVREDYLRILALVC
jgi:histone acetyltransferase 1